MRYTVTKQIVRVIGTLWTGQTATMAYLLKERDLNAMGDPRNRVDVADWLSRNTGDFHNIIDFHANFTLDDVDVIHEWARGEKSETDFQEYE